MTSTETPSISVRRQLLLVLGTAVGMSGGFAVVYFGTLSVFLAPLASAYGWGRAQTSAVSVMAMLGLAPGAVLAGRLIDRFGVRRVIGIAVMLFAVALITLPQLPNSVVLLASFSFLIGLVSAGTTPAGYLTVLPQWFDRQLGLALGMAMVGLGIGTVLMPLVAQHWIAVHGWRHAYALLAGVVIALGALAQLLIFPPGLRQHAITNDATPVVAVVGEGFAPAAATWRFWLLAAVLFAVSASGLGAVVHVASLYADRGFAPDVAARGAAIIGAGMILGRLIIGALLDVAHAPRIAAAAFILGAAGLAIIAMNPHASFELLAVAALLIGFTIGAEGDFIPFFVRRYFGLKSFGLIYGFFFCLYSLGGVVGPVLFGLVFDRTGDYRSAVLAASLTCALCALATLWMGPYRYGSGAK